ncbi:globin [Stakelama sp. CBK3Z-3]|uniref:Globin n=1 Tax=Stakelama flava TaxID=2860338 RepID=A0ABS6XNG6_9SPHN|nr:globin [Stakelama flava]MBW4331742.1 globin [Stakelama flava]
MSETLFTMVGGADAVRDLSNRFYARIDREPKYRELRALHGRDLAAIADSLSGFLTGWLGGPRDWFESGRGCIFSLHRSIPIDEETAGQWVDAMQRTLAETSGIPDSLSTRMVETLDRMARAMAKASSDPAG